MANGNSKSLHVVIVSPERVLYDREVESVSVPGQKGAFEIHRNHAAIISSLQTGRLKCVGSEPFELDVAGGFVEVAENEVSICVEMNPE